MEKNFIIKHFENCPVCGRKMKAEPKEYYSKSGRLTVEYKCPKSHKAITKSIKNFEIK